MTIRLPKGINPDLTYYLAGPMTGYPDFNYPAFECAVGRLSEAGLTIASPHTNPWPERRSSDKPQGGEELWQFMMKSALRQLLECQGCILLRGWPASRGAVLEASIASALKMPMYFLDGDFLVALHDDNKENRA